MSGADDQRIAVTRPVAGSADRVWDLVADVTRMGEWSPETTACAWVGGATGPTVGARFKGRNQIGWRRWSTTCTVTAADRGREFAFRVRSVGGLPVADWGFLIEPTAGGCTVTETWEDQRGWVIRALGRLATGVDDRAAHNRRSMEQTLERLAAAVDAMP